MEPDKPDYDDSHTNILDPWLDEPNLQYTKFDVDLFPAEYGYKKGYRIDSLQQSTKIKNVERRLMDLEEQLKISNGYIAKLTKQIQKISQPDRMDPDSLWQQSAISRKELMSIFGIDSDDKIDTKELDGLLSDYVDPEQDSRDLIRSIRGG